MIVTIDLDDRLAAVLDLYAKRKRVRPEVAAHNLLEGALERIATWIAKLRPDTKTYRAFEYIVRARRPVYAREIASVVGAEPNAGGAFVQRQMRGLVHGSKQGVYELSEYGQELARIHFKGQ